MVVQHPTGESNVIFLEMQLGLTQKHSEDNVAPRGRAAQSAGPASVATGPEMAIDSYKDPQHSGTTCASVPTQDDPWWRVDLMSIYHITAVSVFSEQHCCQEQLDGAEIRIGLRNDTNNHRCAIISAAEGHTEYGYQCGVVLGRFVYVVLPGQQRNLTVCEVQVYKPFFLPVVASDQRNTPHP
uniref:Fucolectin tachylectin-4 pentraxin-1 domain-containing protein n=1 Tax=Nothobranchius furzeri TaxID=105023 RepID=A0A8C6NM07_NOTFU